MDAPDELSEQRQLLIGAYFTQEYALEGAALFNPSMVAHPDQGGLATGSTRFLMTVRALGDGHVSSIEFRTGTIDSQGKITLDQPAEVVVAPEAIPTRYSRASFRHQLHELGGDRDNSDFVLAGLPASFTTEDLDLALSNLHDQRLTRGAAVRTIERLERIAASNYSVEFPEASAIRERVLMPHGPSECKGMEDARMIRFTSVDGSATYLGTYTAFDGFNVVAQLLRTNDFRTFSVEQLSGPGSKNKGIALFPRPIGGHFAALSRADRESNGLTLSKDQRHWEQPVLVQTPHNSWELVQLGNCGPPIETEAGWLVLTHGVGPMRQYCIGAILLDLDDPTILIGSLPHPILTPTEDERDGYVPNVVYSCGAMLHGRRLVLPYGCGDSHTRIALIDLDPLLDALRASAAIKESP
jgi:predicted GH43/DUF377 family glycosyl hydrolase